MGKKNARSQKNAQKSKQNEKKKKNIKTIFEKNDRRS